MSGKETFPTVAIFAALLCVTANAEPTLQVTSDLDGDGHAERFALIGLEDGEADLEITTNGQTRVFENMAWVGAMYGQEPRLERAPNGALRLISQNSSIGRNRWELTLTITFRRESYLVAGTTYHWYDTLDLNANGLCDVNLLTGRGTLTVAERPAQEITTTAGGVILSEWTDAHFWDGPCAQAFS